MNEALNELRSLNNILAMKRAQGEELTTYVNGKPHLRVLNLDPLIYERFIKLGGNPRLVGEFTVHALFSMGDSNGNRIVPWGAIEAPNNELLGVRIKSPARLNQIGQLLTGDANYDSFGR